MKNLRLCCESNTQHRPAYRFARSIRTTSTLAVTEQPARLPIGVWQMTSISLFMTGTSLNIYSQVALVMLIGLIAKNGVLLVEFADQLRDEGLGTQIQEITPCKA